MKLFPNLLLFSCVLLAGSLVLVRYTRGQAPAPSQQVERKAFLATIVETRYTAQGEAGIHEVTTYAVRSNGSEAWATQRPISGTHPAQFVEMRVVLDSVSRKRISVDPSTESVTTTPLPHDFFVRRLSANKGCGSTSVDQIKVAGLSAFLIKDSLKLPDGTAKGFARERWLAPGLDCFTMREVFFFGNDPASASRTIKEVSSVSMIDPPQALFDIPTTYVERSPSAVFAEHVRRFGGESSPSGATLDKAYLAARERNK